MEIKSLFLHSYLSHEFSENFHGYNKEISLMVVPHKLFKSILGSLNYIILSIVGSLYFHLLLILSFTYWVSLVTWFVGLSS
jgi:hypothetical protein